MDIAVLLPQSAIPDEGCETEVEEFGEGAGFGVVGVREAGAVEAAQDCGEGCVQGGGEVGVFLVGANYVGGGGVGVEVARGMGLGGGILGGWRSGNGGGWHVALPGD